MKVVYVDLNRCVGCMSCQRICTFHQVRKCNGQTPNIWVSVDMDRRMIFTSTCLQCQSAWCLRACPVGALSRDPETQAVVVDETACVGCGMCIISCPFGNIHMEPRIRVAAKCDLCGGRPECVQVCMAQALHFGDINELADIKRKQARNSHQMNLMIRAMEKKDVDPE